MNHICFISLSITHIDDNIIEEVIVDIWRRDLAMLSDLNETQPFPRTLCHWHLHFILTCKNLAESKQICVFI